MTTPHDLDERFRTAVGAIQAAGGPRGPGEPVRAGTTLTGGQLTALFHAQLTSRHLDLAARWLRSFGEGFYTIGSAGHEGNAAVAAALRPTDPALLHYRSGAFYCARAAQLGAVADEPVEAGSGAGGSGAEPAGFDAARAVLRGLVASASDPISGGRHKVFGHPDLHIIPTTSTIASHLPRAVGLAFAIERCRRLDTPLPWPSDAIAVASFGDASVNHASAAAAFNTAGWCDHSALRLPLLLVCEDNGLGISVRSPAGWVAAALRSRPGLRYFAADGCDPAAAYDAAAAAASWVRRHRRPAVLHLTVVRLMGHAGADAEVAYRTAAEIAGDADRDPLLATAALLISAGQATGEQIVSRYDEVGWQVRRIAEEVLTEAKIADAAAVVSALAPRRPVLVARAVAEAATAATPVAEPPPSAAATPVAEPPPATAATPVAEPPPSAAAPPDRESPTAATDAPPPAAEPPAAAVAPAAATGGDGTTGRGYRSARLTGAGAAARATAFGGRLPEAAGPLTLAATITATLTDALLSHPGAVVFGQDVAGKGGVYGVTKGLRDRFGPSRVFDTLLDETSILGLALGAGLAGLLPVPEIQYLAYLHNAEDQLRGEAATMRFFSQGAYRNPMVLRLPGLAYQEGFGGHFHNENSVAVLRDIPGLVIAVPARAEDAAGMLRSCLASAAVDGSVCVFLEPIALYHARDLYADGDGQWLAPYPAPRDWGASHVPLGRARVYPVGAGTELTIVTFGNGLRMCLRVAAALAEENIGSRVVDLRWLAPLPVADLIRESAATGRVLVVDETRRSGGVGEGVMAALVDAGYVGAARRIAAVDSFVPLGPAAKHVLVTEDSITQGARALLGR